ncbi:pol-like protein [Metarhizium guizhouense ARSEF 977]|uniref:Pol-like protein n=1 Tax=Metarhizium guizhouense (strain ARSEF 977) TaxID=1276136 RepID=A0A0B4GPV2_METGA|nr:pol-like protein [Metarhizium guizhouense ARSEF 977]
MEDYNLTSTLIPGTITYEEGERQATIDLCLVTVGLADRVIRSEVDRDFDHDSDHLPVVTSFDLSVKQLSREPRKNWKSIDEKKFKSVVLRNLPPLRRPRTRGALDQYEGEMVAALQNAIETAVPQRIWSPKARRGWDEECTRVLAEAKRLRRLHNLYHTDETWEAYRKARNHKGRVIKKALRRGHRENVEKASESPEALWKMARWARNRNAPAPEVTPALQHPDTLQMTSDTAEKADIFRRAFFPCPPEADISDIEGAVYPERIDMPAITEQEVERAIREASPLKAPGPDSIPNKALQLVTTWIKPHLAALFNQSLTLGYCPQHFRESTTVVLRKHGKDNYTVPGSYRPIGLLNTIGKIMDAIIANRLSYVAETYDLLPVTHIGGRKLRSAEHAIHHIIDKIYEAWNRGQGQVASLLLLDVSGAFDNVSHKRLLHNLRKRRIDEKTVRWISSLLEDRHTRVSMDGFKTERHNVSTGTVQGSPLSPILYIFYNADLIERCNLAEDTTATGFIDDVAILTWGDTTTETCAKLQCALQTAEQWAKNSCLSLLTKQVPAHALHKGTHESRHKTSTANSVGRDPGKTDLQILRNHHGLCATMETSHRRDTSEGDEDNLGLEQSGRLDVGPYVPRYEEDIQRSGCATDYVRMLCVVKRELENAKHAVHQQNAGKLAKPAGKGGQINLWCLQSHVNPSLGHRNTSSPYRTSNLETQY